MFCRTVLLVRAFSRWNFACGLSGWVSSRCRTLIPAMMCSSQHQRNPWSVHVRTNTKKISKKRKICSDSSSESSLRLSHNSAKADSCYEKLSKSKIFYCTHVFSVPTNCVGGIPKPLTRVIPPMGGTPPSPIHSPPWHCPLVKIFCSIRCGWGLD